MAYDNKIENLRALLLATVGAAGNTLGMPGLWMAYLTAIGYTEGSLIDRMAKAAAAAGKPLVKYAVEAAGLGPENAPAANSGGWAINLNGGLAGTVTQDGTGIHFAGANNIASVFKQAGGLVLADNGLYEVVFTVANFTGGGVRVLLGANTLNHGASGTTRSANGTYTERLALTGTFSSTNIIRIQVTGASGTNSLDIPSISVKQVF